MFFIFVQCLYLDKGRTVKWRSLVFVKVSNIHSVQVMFGYYIPVGFYIPTSFVVCASGQLPTFVLCQTRYKIEGAFRTQSKIYKGAFFTKIVNDFKMLLISPGF